MRVPVLLVLVLTGCPRTESADDGGASTQSSATAASSVALAPLVDNNTTAIPLTSETARPTPLAPLVTGTAVVTSPTRTVAVASASSQGGISAQGQFRACCNALRTKSQQPSAQAAQLAQAAAICDGLVAAMGSAGGAPQLEQIRPLLQGAALPPVCQGL
jgi:hypothetical protein